jgi:hypothetical protein
MLAVFAVLQKDGFFQRFRADFHKQYDTLWNSVMSVPEKKK